MNKFTPTQISQARSIPIPSLLGLEVKGRYVSSPCPMCGGDDRFQVKIKENFWLCRQCGTGKYQDVIALIMQRDSLNFAGAIESLLGVAAVTPLPKPSKSAPPVDVSDFIEQCREHYQGIDHAMDYAISRGLTAATLQRFFCGSHGRYKNLTFPYFTEDRKQVTAVRYRLRKEWKGNKILSLKGSRFVIPFGLQALDGRATLVICEGEINALSIAQSSDVDVLSFGSESFSIDSPQMQCISDVAERYEHVVIWCDKATISQKIGRLIPHATLRQSPKNLDANDLLQRGLLVDFMARILPSTTIPTSDGLTITVHYTYTDGLIAGLLDGDETARPYRLIDGVAYEADGKTGLVSIKSAGIARLQAKTSEPNER